MYEFCGIEKKKKKNICMDQKGEKLPYVFSD